jgi:hypothetical protein
MALSHFPFMELIPGWRAFTFGLAVAHQELRSSRSFKNTVRWSGFSDNSGKDSRNFAITIGLVRRKNVLISASTSSVDMYARLGS